MLSLDGFPLASPLPSTVSASGCPDLFDGFPGTTELSDFPSPFIIDVDPEGFLDAVCSTIATDDYGISRFPCEMRPCMPGSQTAQGPIASCDVDAIGMAFRPSTRRRHPRVSLSRLNGWPALPPVNASPPPLRVVMHDSGLIWVAIPFIIGLFHPLHLAGFDRRT